MSDKNAIATLIVETPGGEAESHSLFDGQALRIGRANGNDIPLADSKVSRFHTVFSASSTGVVVSDLQSLNGTFVNNRRISTAVVLGSDDIVRIGDARLRVIFLSGFDFSETDSVVETQKAKLESVYVTVLLADICGYTKISEAIPEKELAKMLEKWFQAVGGIVEECGGEVDKFIGDCVMALWRSHDMPPEMTARRAARAAVEIHQKTTQLSAGATWAHTYNYPWECRVTLHTGEALMGTMGKAAAKDFTVLGNTVNFAFRLDEVAGDLGSHVYVSQATAGMLGNELSLRSLGHFQVEGSQLPTELFTASAPT